MGLLSCYLLHRTHVKLGLLLGPYGTKAENSGGGNCANKKFTINSNIFKTDVDSHGDAKQIDSTQDPLLHNVHLGWDKQESNTRNSTVDTVKPTLFHEVESGHSSSGMTISNKLETTYICL